MVSEYSLSWQPATTDTPQRGWRWPTAADDGGPRGRATAADTRERILDAAAQVMGTLGLARATTRQIARAAGYSEATLYKHFPDKTELLLAVLAERLPPLVALLARLPDQAGQAWSPSTWRRWPTRPCGSTSTASPCWPHCSPSRPCWPATARNSPPSAPAPQRANQALAAYLAADRDLGRIDASVDPDAAAAMLLGACFQRAFLSAFRGQPTPDAERARLAASLVATLLPKPARRVGR